MTVALPAGSADSPTIASNGGGDGSAISVAEWKGVYNRVALTNTILVSHTVGISVTGGNTVTVNAVLWSGTPVTVSAPISAIVALSNQLVGDPAFVDPEAGDYHIGHGSAALDTGVETAVAFDIDGDPRALGPAPDIGADEAVPLVFLPLVLRSD